MGMLRLTNGLTQYEGRVEMYWNSEWKFICNDEWDERDAVVVCRQLGYLATSIQIHGDHEYHCMIRFPETIQELLCNTRYIKTQ